MEGGSTLVLCANAVYAVAIKPYNHVVIGLTIYVVVSIVNTKFMLFLHCGARRQMFIYRCMNVEWILFCYMGFCISYPCIASQKWHQPFSYFLLQGARVFYNILQLEYRRILLRHMARNRDLLFGCLVMMILTTTQPYCVSQKSTVFLLLIHNTADSAEILS